MGKDVQPTTERLSVSIQVAASISQIIEQDELWNS